jgi:hypothetical protein
MIAAKFGLAVVLVSIVMIGLRMLRLRTTTADPLRMGLLEGWATMRGGKRSDAHSVAVPSEHGPIRIGSAIGQDGHEVLTFRLLLPMRISLTAVARRNQSSQRDRGNPTGGRAARIRDLDLGRVVRKGGAQKRIRFNETNAFYRASASDPQRWKSLLLDGVIRDELSGWSAFTIAVEPATAAQVRALPVGFYVFVSLGLPITTPTAKQLDAGVRVVARTAELLGESTS